jgi:predicted GIY-YIG superfamily endonuclease
MTNTDIYVLKLEGERYYIGKSNNVTKRYQQHLNGEGSAWTKKYKPINLEKTIKNVSVFEEDKITKEYMIKYGIDKVRGGSYVEINLSDFQLDALKMEIFAAYDACTRCGRKGHFIKDCYAKTDSMGNNIDSDDSDEDIEWCCEYCDRTFTTEFGCNIHEKSCIEKKNSCYRCGRLGHYSTECYASKHIKGYYL